MADDEKINTQIEAGDPFSVFSELENIHSEGRRGLHLFSSKMNELLLEVTVRGETGVVTESEKKLAEEAAKIYIKNIRRIQRARDLIEMAREARSKQG